MSSMSMPTITKGLSVLQLTSIDLHPPLVQLEKAMTVHVRLVFLRIGEIDTLNEKYQAHASIESRWIVPQEKFSYNLSPDDHQRFLNGRSVSLEKYSVCHWHPQIYIQNAVGDLKEQVKYSAKIYDAERRTVQLCEHRDIRGSFWEKLELHHFPSDVQDLSISITSMFFHDKVVLIADPCRFSGVNREAFSDQQKWSLYEHVDTKQRFIKEFLFATDGDDTGDDEGIDSQPMREVTTTDDRRRSVLTVTCHAARQPAYFYWNGYFLILLITLVSFCTFGLPLKVVVNRLQVSCTLLLTSITFRWTVNRSLPTVSYLTSLDKYSIACIFNLVLHSFWHSAMSVVMWETTADNSVTKESSLMLMDRCAFGVFLGGFVFLHLAASVWFYCVPYKRQQQMTQKDIQYRRSMHEKAKRN